jgi:hypothetical protein
MNRSGFATTIVLLAVFALAVIGGIAWVHFVYLPKMAAQNSTASQSAPNPIVQSPASSATITSTSIQSNSASTATTTTTCDNYQCLIAAASQCQPISVTISYSGMPFPLDPDISESGQTKYEIQKSSGVNNCNLIFSSPITVLSVSEKGRAAALAQGMTDAQINAQLQTMNNSLKSEVVTQSQNTCPSNTSTISAYLAYYENDLKNGNLKVEGEANSTGQTTTYTTSSGQKLVCTVIPPAGQPANTAVTITNAECTAQKGTLTAVSNDGTACFKDQIDLGTITGGLKLNYKYPQCCASK